VHIYYTAIRWIVKNIACDCGCCNAGLIIIAPDAHAYNGKTLLRANAGQIISIFNIWGAEQIGIFSGDVFDCG